MKDLDALHVFNPDHNLYCLDCGFGELFGNHGMIPGDGGAAGKDFSPMYRDEAVRKMYEDTLDLTDFEERRPDYKFRQFLGGKDV